MYASTSCISFHKYSENAPIIKSLQIQKLFQFVYINVAYSYVLVLKSVFFENGPAPDTAQSYATIGPIVKNI